LPQVSGIVNYNRSRNNINDPLRVTRSKFHT